MDTGYQVFSSKGIYMQTKLKGLSRMNLYIYIYAYVIIIMMHLRESRKRYMGVAGERK